MRVLRHFGLMLLPALIACGLLGCTPSGDPAPEVAGTTDFTERTVPLDPKLAPYETRGGLAGTVRIVGSDTMENTLSLWGHRFADLYDDVEVDVEAKGSVTAPPALASGAANVGPMSRPMRDAELTSFINAYGYAPTRVAVAIDGLAIYVSKDNPLDRLSLPQLDAIFSATLNCGESKGITTWGELGLQGEWENAPINLYGRNPLSGTYGYFQEHVLCDGEFNPAVEEQISSAAVVQNVTQDKHGLGYSGIAYRTPSIRALALAHKKKEFYYTAETAKFYSTNYPLSRRLYVYVNKKPDQPADPLVLEFIEFALSQEGQQAVVKDGFIPLPADVARRELAKLR